MKLDGKTRILRSGESATIEPNRWHEWWNASDRDARVRVEVAPAAAFPHSPPLAVQRALFGALAPVARWRGYRATYPEFSRTVLAPRA